MHRQPVFKAVHAARILRHVAADGAGELAAGIRGVVQTEGGRRLADGEVSHSGLNFCRAPERINFQYPVEFRERQAHARRVWQRTARQAGAGAARHDRHALRMA